MFLRGHFIPHGRFVWFLIGTVFLENDFILYFCEVLVDNSLRVYIVGFV